jgi:AraC family transcriptional regulator of adaptative response/methylated-DNA-[protein]-cysteine methyltransferase
MPEKTMSEHLRYAHGHSSLGGFIAAVSDRGLIAFEFGDDRAALVDALHRRFAGAVIESDETGLAATIDKLAALADHPEHDPGLALDLRGTDYEKRVWTLLRDIPPGRTTHYGALAAKMGTPRDAREVTEAIAANAIAILIPCHRVVKKDGSLSGYRWGFWRKRALLSREQSATAFQLA